MEEYTYKKLTLESFTKAFNEIQDKIFKPVAYIIRDGKIYEYFPAIEYNISKSAQHPTSEDENVR